MFVTDISLWQEYARRIDEFLYKYQALQYMIEGKRLIEREYLVESK